MKCTGHNNNYQQSAWGEIQLTLTLKKCQSSYSPCHHTIYSASVTCLMNRGRSLLNASWKGAFEDGKRCCIVFYENMIGHFIFHSYNIWTFFIQKTNKFQFK
ncbi:unnamed protein product [Cuscuta epithymum]|uniref:Uncharacterized protein n=1 Tax=Cuscuta epithymum TaxID=186058 RepID=A0AAV0GC46_9ASTE|nr:unnamed protein product [Cuscuta epithymum]